MALFIVWLILVERLVNGESKKENGKAEQLPGPTGGASSRMGSDVF
jgi:hypothetical protein